MNKKSFYTVSPVDPCIGGAYFVAFERLVRKGIISELLRNRKR